MKSSWIRSSIAVVFVLLSFIPISHASIPQPVIDYENYSMTGYNGNSTIYMVNGLGNGNFQQCPGKSEEAIMDSKEINCSSVGNENGGNYKVQQALNLRLLEYAFGPAFGDNGLKVLSTILFSDHYDVISTSSSIIPTNFSRDNVKPLLNLSLVSGNPSRGEFSCVLGSETGLNTTTISYGLVEEVKYIHEIAMISPPLMPGLCNAVKIFSLLYRDVEILQSSSEHNYPRISSPFSSLFMDAFLGGGSFSCLNDSGKWVYQFKDSMSYEASFCTVIAPSIFQSLLSFNFSASLKNLRLSPSREIESETVLVPSNQIVGEVIMGNNGSPLANMPVSLCYISGEKNTSSGPVKCAEIFHMVTNGYGFFRFFAKPDSNYRIFGNSTSPSGNISFSRCITTGTAGNTTFEEFSAISSSSGYHETSNDESVFQSTWKTGGSMIMSGEPFPLIPSSHLRPYPLSSIEYQRLSFISASFKVRTAEGIQ